MAKTTIDVSTKTFVRFWGVVIGIALVAFLLWKASGALILIGVAAFLAIAINPLVRKIDAMIPGKDRTLPTALSYVLVVGVLVAILSVAVPAAVSEIVRFVSAIPGFVESAQIDWGVIDGIGRNFGINDASEMIMSGLSQFSQGFVANFGGVVIESATAVGGFITNLIVVLVMAFLMLIEGPQILKWIWIGIDKISKNKGESRFAKETVGKMADVVGKFVSGEMVVATINWGITTMLLVIVSVAFGMDVGLALPFGMITALFSLIPIFGTLLGGLIVAALLCLTSWGGALAFLVAYLIYAQFEGNVIYPKVQGRGLKLPTLVVLASVITGIYMFGILGALLAVPVAACVKVWLTNYTIRGERRE